MGFLLLAGAYRSSSSAQHISNDQTSPSATQLDACVNHRTRVDQYIIRQKGNSLTEMGYRRDRPITLGSRQKEKIDEPRPWKSRLPLLDIAQKHGYTLCVVCTIKHHDFT
jgi:hypothetical protein